MITHLISTTEFINFIHQNYNQLGIEFPFDIIVNYVNFISQKPTLSMFVPCDENGNVLDEPEIYDTWIMYSISNLDTKFETNTQCEQYKEAKSNILFKDKMWDIKSLKEKIEYYDTIENFAIKEHFFNKLVLTKTSLKQIGL